MPECPYCGRALGENEAFCWYCEQDLINLDGYKNKPSIPLKHHINKLISQIKALFRKLKEKLNSIKNKGNK